MLFKKLLFLIAFSFFVINSYTQSVRINEIMSSNGSTVADEDGDFSDWIEIFNASGQSINLEGFGISDNIEIPAQWQFPSIELQPGEYRLIWLSGKDRREDNLHTSFSISASGEFLLLTSNTGIVLDQLEVPALRSDVSFGRKADGSNNWFFFHHPTPGAPNTSQTYSGILPDPVFSHTGGFYTSSFSLTVASDDPSARVVYTRDASAPAVTSPVFPASLSITSRQGDANRISLIPSNHSAVGPPYYEGWQAPQGEVFKVNVVRAQAFRENFIPSRIITHTYLVDPRGANRYSLPVVFLNSDDDHFFDSQTGIYSPSGMWGEGPEWERPVHLELFDTNRTQGWSGDMGIRIHGNTTRSRPRRSLRVYARGEYGDSWMNYRLFPTKDISMYKRFVLRNSGNDWDQSIFRDGFMQYLARDMNVQTQYFRPSVVFINGEYWGIHGIRDRYDHHYILSHFGLQEHEMTIMENDAVYTHGNPEGVDHYSHLYNYIRTNGVASTSNYKYVNTLMDVESFIDFQIANIYSMNTDWPGNNGSYFRRNIPEYLPDAPPGLDGRWRWMIRDMDFGFWLDFFYVPGVDEGATHNTLAMAADPSGSGWPNPPWSTRMLRRFLLNTEFKNIFINRFADMLNTTYKAEHVLAVLDSIQQALQPEMQEHIDRWRRPTTLSEWQQNVERMKSFAGARTNSQRQHIQSFFNLSGQVNVALAVQQSHMGSIRINTIEPDVQAGWTGIYFRGIPISLTAKAAMGYRFSHWSGSNTSSQAGITLTPAGNITLTAHFEPDPDFQGDELNPAAHKLSQGNYSFTWWDENQNEDSFPENMLFLQSSQSDPGLADAMTHRYHIPGDDYSQDDQGIIGFPYKTTSRSRINGLGQDGISFINTGRTRDLGAAVLALDTRGIDAKDITVEWTGGTVIPNSRVYAIRLQYKIGVDGTFKDFISPAGIVMEYRRSSITGHEQPSGPVVFPEEAGNQEYVQLRWKYYFTGEQLPLGHNRRDMLRLDDIHIKALSTNSGQDINILQPTLFQNHPNPATGTTTISFSLVKSSEVQIELYDGMGRRKSTLVSNHFAPGLHTVDVNLHHLKPGIYIYRIITPDYQATRRMVVSL